MCTLPPAMRTGRSFDRTLATAMHIDNVPDDYVSLGAIPLRPV